MVREEAKRRLTQKLTTHTHTFIQTDPTGAAVLNVAVAPSARRRGIGRALLRGAASMARAEWGAESLYTSVAATNDAARALYADLGFGEVGDAVAAVAGATSLGALVGEKKGSGSRFFNSF